MALSVRCTISSFLLALLCFPLCSVAQPTLYQPDESVKVFAYGHEQTLAWCGGFNNPQFASADLNQDGLPDLVVFMAWTGVQTFINKGTAGNPDYRYSPYYALNFPPLYSYMIMADYNCDGIPDLFHQGNTGFSVYRAYYKNQQLCFAYYTDLYYNNDVYAGGAANAFNNPGDIPSIADVDGDGDMDFVSYDISGGKMNLYRNLRKELGLPCDSIRIALKDRCWGKLYQGFYRSHMLDFSCSNEGLLKTTGSAAKKTHSGNTPCLFDWDMDGDMDYLDGSVSFNEMTFLKNGKKENGIAIDSMIYQDTVWQGGGTPINMPIWPAAFNIDADQDGKKDILVAPNGGAASENYKCIWYYQNLSTPGAPNWQFRSDSFLVDKSIDLGTASYPALFDYNKDGKPDLFVGSDGYYQSSGLLQSRLSLYLNTSAAGSPSLTLQTTDFMNLATYGFRGGAPAFGDIDNDGKTDMLLGHVDGTLTYFKNIATSEAVTPIWQLEQLKLQDADGAEINVSGNAAPFVYDIDKDGKKDLIIGSTFGTIHYYQNITTVPGTISLKLVNTKLGGAKADPRRNFSIYSAPFIGKIDSTGTEYLLLGSNSGNIYRYTGFQGGDTTATYTLLDAGYAHIDSTYNGYNHPGTPYGVYGSLRSTLTVGDIAGDGSSYMITGNVRGGLELFKYKPLVSLPVYPLPFGGAPAVQVYPNPAKDILVLKWTGISDSELQVSIVNMAGQLLHTATTRTVYGGTTVPLAQLPQGIYICITEHGGHRIYNKFVIVR